MKKIVENVEEVKSSDSLNEYLMSIKSAIDDETKAIALYDSILKNSSIPASAKEALTEILNDEKDHLVILTALLSDEVEESFPDHGDFSEIIDEDEEDKD